MYLGYNTNGFAHHRLDDALALLAELGYEGVGLTLDHHVLNPFDTDWFRHTDHVRGLLEKHKLRAVIETGARFLLDPRRKHQPTLLSSSVEDRHRRLQFLTRCVETAWRVGAEVVSFWSGTAIDDAPEATLWQRLTYGCHSLLSAAEVHGVRLAFEPEPGMFIDTLASYRLLREHLGLTRGGAVGLGLTMDIGHLHCQGETPIADQIREWSRMLWNVHIEDMRAGVHDHLMFGEGEIAFAPVMEALAEVRYEGGVFVELSRHSHDAVVTAKAAHAFLKAFTR